MILETEHLWCDINQRPSRFTPTFKKLKMQPDKVREQGAIRDPASNYAFFLEFFSPHLILSADQQNHTRTYIHSWTEHKQLSLNGT